MQDELRERINVRSRHLKQYTVSYMPPGYLHPAARWIAPWYLHWYRGPVSPFLYTEFTDYTDREPVSRNKK
ncbi:hypothetical protein KQX54_014437 [Cotesia glomerata]|uniref:Uncharacterized protein n=1 Tax=Cotesia glomerata TaxID=32391 RepID=A0AAV7IWR7_COTGL|nr:hypothetical protein KQX54_014437 [Cotesia glomerata]